MGEWDGATRKNATEALQRPYSSTSTWVVHYRGVVAYVDGGQYSNMCTQQQTMLNPSAPVPCVSKRTSFAAEVPQLCRSMVIGAILVEKNMLPAQRWPVQSLVTSSELAAGLKVDSSMPARHCLL